MYSYLLALTFYLKTLTTPWQDLCTSCQIPPEANILAQQLNNLALNST